jgi:hypothetical protein
MTDYQVMTLLSDLGVKNVSREKDRPLMLTVVTKTGVEQITVSEFKSRFVKSLKELEERRAEVGDNKFAAPLRGQIPLGGDSSMQVQYLKKDEQLTSEERARKKQLLEEIERDVRNHRTIIAGLNYLQLYYKQIVPKFRKHLADPGLRAIVGAGEPRILWTKGIKMAALFCIKEFKKEPPGTRKPLDVCRDFLAKYTIQEEQSYTPEQLCNNVHQIMQLDDTD